MAWDMTEDDRPFVLWGLLCPACISQMCAHRLCLLLGTVELGEVKGAGLLQLRLLQAAIALLQRGGAQTSGRRRTSARPPLLLLEQVLRQHTVAKIGVGTCTNI